MPYARAVKVASAQYPVDFLNKWDTYRDKMVRMVGEAARYDAGLLVFPEYASMELVSLFGADVRKNLQSQLEALQECHAGYVELYRELSKRFGVYILAGSFPVKVDRGYRNRAYLAAPSGQVEFQDKLIMTRFENEQWFVSPGQVPRVFDTAFGRLGIQICYDVEFPLLSRSMTEAGAEIILAPSCTDTMAGYFRVQIGCRARALENQCYVVQSPLVGTAAWSEAIDVNVGAAGLYTPVDHDFPSDGMLVRGEMNTPGWVYGTLDLDRIREVRESGQVFNYRDWSLQCVAAPVEVVPV